MWNNTPLYRGPGNTAVARNGNGWMARLGQFLVGGTPLYRGNGQPSPGTRGGLLGSTMPIYKPAPGTRPPTENTSSENASTGTQGMAQVMTGCPVDPDPFGSGPIAIIVPRPGF